MKLKYERIPGYYFGALTFLLLISLSRVAEGQGASITHLKVGDKAPPLNAIWLKGSPTGSFGDGKVHVVEFWATWCGPCRVGMPHLSKLAQKYRGQVDVTAISIWEYTHIKDKKLDYMKRVRPFVDNSHDMMDYIVGSDVPEDVIANTWPAAAGIGGIPTAFIIDQEGKIAWIGGPIMGLDELVELALEKKLNKETVKRVTEEAHARLTEQTRLQGVCESALKAGNYQQALDSADRALIIAPIADDYMIPLKYQALDKMDREKGRAYAREIMETHKNAPILLISQLARKILSDDNPNPDYQLALEFMQTGMRDVDPGEGYQIELLAKAYFKTGNIKMAIKTQKELLRSMDNPVRETTKERKEEAQKQLAIYQGNI